MSTTNSDQFDESTASLSSTEGSDIRSRKRPRTSWVWNHIPDDRHTLYHDNQGRVQWRCKYCTTTYLENGGTAVIMNHLGKHGIKEDSTSDQKGLRIQASIQHAFQRASETNYPRRRTVISLDPSQFEILFVRWIASCSIPFRIVECEEFRALLQYINHTCDEWLPTSHTTVKDWVIRTFRQEQEHVKQSL